MRPLNILFFYLTKEEQYQEDTKEVVGYMRIVNLNTKETIEKIEVSHLKETFFRLKKCLQSVASPVVNIEYPNSEQCFAVEWNDSLIEGIRTNEKCICLICKEISESIKTYASFLKQSGRFQAVS